MTTPDNPSNVPKRRKTASFAIALCFQGENLLEQEVIVHIVGQALFHAGIQVGADGMKCRINKVKRLKNKPLHPKKNSQVQPNTGHNAATAGITGHGGSEKAEAKRPGRREYQRMLMKVHDLFMGDESVDFEEFIRLAKEAKRLARK